MLSGLALLTNHSSGHHECENPVHLKNFHHENRAQIHLPALLAWMKPLEGVGGHNIPGNEADL
jgi:hypothetical protein